MYDNDRCIYNGISIHALLAESDTASRAVHSRRPQFLSTLSLRRATAARINTGTHCQNFYPRSPCGERRQQRRVGCHANCISIHALLAESDKLAACDGLADAVFLSTLSLRRATALEGVVTFQQYDFYPRSPCGERRIKLRVSMSFVDISIHALLAESDHEIQWEDIRYESISIHALLAESDLDRLTDFTRDAVFLSTLSLRRATSTAACRIWPLSLFLSTLSLRRATAKVHKTVGHFCAYETNFMEIASSC